MRSIRFLPFDQLHRNFGVLKEADKKEDLIVLIESQAMVTGADWHPERLFFLFSAARHFASELESDGYQVKYLKAKNTVTGLKEIQKSHPNTPLICAEQSSFRLSKNLSELTATYLTNDFFLTSRSDFKLWADSQKTFLMENFYRKQRVRLNILMAGKDPVGGAWNFDKENRLPPPKNYTWPAYLEHDRDEIDTQVASELGQRPARVR